MISEFREPVSETELKELFGFRQRIYGETESFKSMVQTNDPSTFDTRAFHFARYIENRPVAYMRMVTRHETKFADWVKNLASQNLQPIPEKIEFPFENYSPDKTWNKSFLESLENKNVGEAGKLAIDKAFRSEAFLETFIQEFLHYCIEEHQFDVGFGICTLTLERFYRRLGFFRAHGAVPFIYQDLPEGVIVRFDAGKNP